jgi:hypothetical protein
MLRASGKIVYVDDPLFESGVFVATYKNVVMSVAEGPDWVSIYSCESGNPGKSEVQEMIDVLRQDFPGKAMWGSVPLNNAMKHLFDKNQIQYVLGGDM